MKHGMKLDFSTYPGHEKSYSARPMTLLDPEPGSVFSAISEIALIETGSRVAREGWQQAQLRNLLHHAIQRSVFWRSRIPTKEPLSSDLSTLPVLTRQELREQVASEGALLKSADRIAVKTHSSSGSSGAPVSFYISEFNGRYNGARSIAQHFMQGQDLSINRTRIRNANAPIENGFSVQKTETWLGPLASLFKSGINKHIDYFTLNTDDCRRLIEELKKDAIGYLVCSPRLLDAILSSFDLQFLKDAKTEIWIPLGENVDPHMVESFSNLAIPIRANYSCEEVGMIGLECDRVAGCYHVATSNVIVEVVDLVHELDGIRRGRILITHLHSYATPFIRYDVGDLGCLAERCPCGHDGPTLSHLHGRLSSVIKHRDGHLSPFYIRGKDLVELAKFDEFRVRQIAFDEILIELGGRSDISDDEVAAISTYLKKFTGPEFQIEVKACPVIDWGQSRKRLAFRCEI